MWSTVSQNVERYTEKDDMRYICLKERDREGEQERGRKREMRHKDICHLTYNE
jgi:hypothetical protein